MALWRSHARLSGTNSKPTMWAGRAAIGAGLGLVGVYAYGAVKFRRTAAVGFDLGLEGSRSVQLSYRGSASILARRASVCWPLGRLLRSNSLL